MTRKHYKQFAEMLRELRRVFGRHDTALFAVEEKIAEICQGDKERFSYERFCQAARGEHVRSGK